MLSKLVKTLHVSLNKEIELGNWHLLTRTLVVQGNEAALFSQTKAFLITRQSIFDLVFCKPKASRKPQEYTMCKHIGQVSRLSTLTESQCFNLVFTDFIHM